MDPTATMDSVTVSWDAPESGGEPDRYIVHLRPAGGKKGLGRVAPSELDSPLTARSMVVLHGNVL